MFVTIDVQIGEFLFAEEGDKEFTIGVNFSEMAAFAWSAIGLEIMMLVNKALWPMSSYPSWRTTNAVMTPGGVSL